MVASRQASFLVAALLLIFGGGAWLLVRNFGQPSELEMAEQAIANRDFRAAREHLDRYRASNPHDLDALFLAARTARRDGELEAALIRLSELEKIAGRTDASEFERELLALQRGNPKLAAKALASCRTAPDSEQSGLSLEAIIESALNLLVDPYADHRPIPAQDLNGTAVPDAREALVLWFSRPLSPPDRAQGHVWRARLLEICGEHAGAILDLREALTLVPEHVHANYLLGLFLLQESPAESQATLKRLCNRQPDNERFSLLYAEALRVGGHIDEARVALDRLLEPRPASGSALLARGRVALDLQNPVEAERFFRQALAASPNSSEAHAAMARCMRLLGRLDEAAKHQTRFEQLEREQQPKK